MSSLLRSLSLLGIALSTSSCDWAWMEQKVRFKDGTEITLQHRSTGMFRTIVANQYGDVSRDYNGAADSRHVSLYKSPSGRMVIADYGTEPMIVEVDQGQRPVEASPVKRKLEYGLSPRWQYIGAVRRTSDNKLQYFPHDPECQTFGVYEAGLPRKTEPCSDANYEGL